MTLFLSWKTKLDILKNVLAALFHIMKGLEQHCTNRKKMWQMKLNVTFLNRNMEIVFAWKTYSKKPNPNFEKGLLFSSVHTCGNVHF